MHVVDVSYTSRIIRTHSRYIYTYISFLLFSYYHVISSISKTLSSILCAWLVRQGIVDWDTPIGQIVPSSGQHTSPSSSLTSSPSTPTSSTSPPTSTSTPPILSDGGLVPNYWRSEWVKLMEDEAEAKKAEEKKKKEKSKGEKEKSKREETGKETALYVKAMSAYKGQGYKSSIPRPVTPVAETIHSQTKNDKFSPFTSQSSPFSTTTSTSSSTAPPPPPFPSHWLSVTLRQLLSHTAGVRGYLVGLFFVQLDTYALLHEYPITDCNFDHNYNPSHSLRYVFVSRLHCVTRFVLIILSILFIPFFHQLFIVL